MEDAEKLRLSVNIYGETYHMKATDDEERILAIVEMVDGQMREIGDKMPQLKYKDIAVLAALNIAELYFKLKDDYNELVALIDEDKQ